MLPPHPRFSQTLLGRFPSKPFVSEPLLATNNKGAQVLGTGGIVTMMQGWLHLEAIFTHTYRHQRDFTHCCNTKTGLPRLHV